MDFEQARTSLMKPPIHSGRKTSLKLFSAVAIATGLFAGSFALAATAAIITSAPTLTPTTLPGANVGTAYNATLPITGGTGPYTATCAETGTSTGLVVTPTASAASTDVLISGTPTTGTATVTCTVTDTTTGLSSTSVIPITVSPAIVVPGTPTLTPATLPAATVGTVYNQNVGITGGTGPYTVSCGGAQPAGLTVTPAVSTPNTTTINITGTPTTAGTTVPITCDVTGATGPLAVDTIPFTVNTMGTLPTPPTLPTAALPGATVGTAYTHTLNITGGTLPDATTCTVTPLTGTTPVGLTATPSATNVVVAGTPTVAGPATVTCSVTDSTGLTSTSVIPLTISPAVNTLVPTLPTAALPSGTVGTMYTTQTLPITGGTGPYTASCAITGTGAPGLTVTPTTSASTVHVVIAGTPTAAGPATVTCTEVDAASNTTTSVLPITVNPTGFVAVAPTLPLTAPSGTVGASYNASLPVTGGTAPGPYAVSCSGTPPAGLTVTPTATLTGENVVISGTPTVAGVTADAINCTVTDSAGLSSTSVIPLTINVPSVGGGGGGGGGVPPVVVPVVTSVPVVVAPTSVTTTTATLNGTVNPSGLTVTSADFCYIVGTTLTDCVGATVDPIAPSTLPSGTVTATFTQALSGLAPNTQYCYQIESTDITGTYYSTPDCFTTVATNAAVAPAVILPSNLRYITHFGENLSSLTAADDAQIRAVAAFIVAHSDLHDALIGYTDPLDTKAYNLALGERRAKSVATQLKKDLAALGVHNVSSSTASAGATDYVVVGLSNSARAADRRVTISVD
jgi:outer membrane protein OmpA-like peptidoglycan-associated protein